MTNKRDLKEYIRYDGTHKIVPSSNILSRVKPKSGGRWTETEAYECCNGDCIPIYVCNAGTTGANGLYTCAGIVNNKPYYIKGVYRLSWGEYPTFYGEYYDEWDIWDGEWNCLYFTGGDDNTYVPNLAEYWISEDGDDPAPTVQLDECSPYSCLCESTLTVGGNGRSVWGYLIESYGSLTPNCSSILALVYFVGEGSALILASNEALKDCIVVTINGTDYSLQYSYQGPYGYEYALLNGENPFPELGETCTIVIDCDVDCLTTTTTTLCVPEGEYIATVPFASSYTPTQGVPTPFINSGADACEAILIVATDGGTFDYFNVDSYSYSDINHYYLADTCTPLPTGYYVFDMEGDIFGCHVTAGVIDLYDICTTTTTTTVAPTTTTTTTVAPTTTTTTTVG